MLPELASTPPSKVTIELIVPLFVNVPPSTDKLPLILAALDADPDDIRDPLPW